MDCFIHNLIIFKALARHLNTAIEQGILNGAKVQNILKVTKQAVPTEQSKYRS